METHNILHTPLRKTSRWGIPKGRQKHSCDTTHVPTNGILDQYTLAVDSKRIFAVFISIMGKQ